MAAVPRVPRSPALVKALVVAGLAVVLCAPLPAPALAAGATDGTDLLASTLLDLAFVQRAPDGPPDLLAVEPDDETRGSVKVGLFHRVGGTWLAVATAAVQVDASSPDVPAPWLMDLGQDRYALLSASEQASRTDIVPLTVGPPGTSDLEVGLPVEVDFTVTDAGAVDVDGGGLNELVVSSSSDRICADTTMAVFAGAALDERRRWTLPHLRLAGAAIGQFDGRQGADLLAHAYDPCPIAPDSGEPHHLVAIRLATGETFADIETPPEQQTGAPLSRPLVVDVDHDGRDEAVVRTGTDLAVIDPSQDWTSTTLGVGDAMPLVALDGPTRVLWVAPMGALRAAGIATIERTSSGQLAVAPDVGNPVTDPVREALDTTFWRATDRAALGGPAPSAFLDIDRDGCPEIVAPMVIAPCLGIRSIDPGPAWLATTPLGGFDGPAGPTVLVALGLEWRPGGNPPDPSPVAAYAAGAGAARQPGVWRHGPSSAFRLVELPSDVLAGGGTPTSPSVDPAVAPDGSVAIGGPSGSRLMVRARPLNPDEAILDVRLTPASLIFGPSDISGTAFMTPPIGGAMGEPVTNGVATASFDVRSLPLLDGSRAERWLLDVAQIDLVGDLGRPVREIAVFDVTPPTLVAEAPLFSSTWPLVASLAGTAEAGAEVRMGDGEPVLADADGAFQLDAQLAPWPQTLGFTAIDAYGNSRTLRVSVMGGLDVRQLPWTAMLTVTFLLAAVVGSARGAHRARPVDAGGPALIDELPLPEIEELSAGGVQRRD